jgi:O-antigen biosynthesis protein
MPDHGPSIQPNVSETYGANYYASHCGPLAYGREEPHWAHFFGLIADEILRSLRPRRVFDAGCAHGFLIEGLWDRGVETAGRDISHFAVSQVRADLQSFVAQGSITDPIEGEYDLITCIEVLEHMPEAEAIGAIAAMTAAAPRLLFSSSPVDLEEPTHVNVKPVIWWLARFAEAGFAPVPEYDASFLTPHAFLLERSEEGRRPRDLAAFAEIIRQRMRATALAGRQAQVEHERNLAVQSANQAAQDASQAAEQARHRESAAAAVASAAMAERGRLEVFLTQAQSQRDAAIAEAAATLARQAERATAATEQEAASAELRARLEAEVVAAQAAWHMAQLERDTLLYSTTWRATRPFRQVAGAMPVSWRRTLRRMARASYWIITLQFGTRMAQWRAAEARRLAPPPPPPPALAEPAPAPEPLTDYERWVRDFDTLDDGDRAAIRAHIDHLSYRPLISVVMPAYETPERLLREAIASVRAQLYPYWELCIADDASPSTIVSEVLREAAAQDSRIKWMRRETNGHIAEATNSALALATGEFVALMDHDDLLPEQALYEIAVELAAHPDADLIYTDEDQVDTGGRRSSPYFKPDWNIDLLLGHNVVSHLGIYRRALLRQIGGLRGGPYDGSQDYDLALRSAAASDPSRIRHIPAVLYHWRRMDSDASFSQAQLDRCIAAAHLAIGDDLDRRGVEGAQVLPVPTAPLWTRVVWPLPEPAPRVSLIVPTRDKPELLARCAAGLLHRTDYPDIELLIVDNDSAEPEALALLDRLRADRRVRVLPYPRAFNYSAINNMAVAEATGEIVVLINNDIDVIDGGWLREMVSLAVRPDVGAVGAKLLYADGTIQHAGVVLGVGAHTGGPGVAGHFGHFEAGKAVGYFGQFVLAREVAAVTGACLALRREVYRAVGGLDAEHLPISFNDVDLCLRIRAKGLRVIWTPFAELYHLESSSRGIDCTPEQVARAAGEADYMRARWGQELDHDPFYNPHFDRIDHTFRLAIPSPRDKPWRQWRS